ncbi:hypothetical protein SEPCBS119000_005376 [Sporothrix epigloea]|uniref:DUF1742-domain-containing protein n=1 Tax=Sporothrix epigloea TaxID=1892477 RepID=A0ABP0DX93_9PEZI
MSFANVYTHRKVAEASAKGCDVCYKPTTSVLITAENKDFFYVCTSHLKERTFCTPIVDKAAEEAKKQKSDEEKEARIREEMERVKKEYEEKKKNDKESKDKDGKTDKPDKEKTETKADEKRNKDKNDKKDEASRQDSFASRHEPSSMDAEPPVAADEPRVFALQKFLYQQRLDKKRQAEVAKRNRERLANPGFFPSVPKGQP